MFKRKLCKDKESRQVEEKISQISTKTKIILINLIYLIFSFLVLCVVYEYLHSVFSNFARFKIMHPITIRTFIDMTVIFFWLIFSVQIYKFNKKFTIEAYDVLFLIDSLFNIEFLRYLKMLIIS